MRNKSTKTKILKTLISLTLALSLLFTAQPTPVHAKVDGAPSSTLSRLAKMIKITNNATSVSVNGQSVESNESAGYLYYAGSQDRTGILIYVVDDEGYIFGEPGLLCSQSMANEILDARDDGSLDDTAMDDTAAGWTKTSEGFNIDRNIMVVDNADLRPVDYTSEWVSRGNSIISWLTAECPRKVNGETVPNWLYYTIATQLAGDTNNAELTNALKGLIDEQKSWAVVIEPVSLNYIYTDWTFNQQTTDKNRVGLGLDKDYWEKGDPVPMGMSPDGSGQATKVLGTARGQLYKERNGKGSTYTWKFLHGALPWSLCLSEPQEIGGKQFNAPKSIDGHRVSTSEMRNTQANGIGFSTLKIECDKPPISTRFTPDSVPDGPNPPEPPEEPFTNGDCIIEKTYVSVSRNDDGEVEAAKVEAYEKQKDTTNKIHIEGNDNNSGYKLEAWAETTSPRGKSKANKTFNTENFKTHTKNQLIKSYLGNNVKNGSGDIEITKGNTLSLVYIKYNRADSKTLGYDFLLEESWLSKAFSFVPMDTDKIASSHAAAEYHHNDFDTVNWAFIADCRK